MFRARAGDRPGGVRQFRLRWRKRRSWRGRAGGTLTVLAASSLTDAFGKLGKTFEQQDPGTTVKTSFGASSDPGPDPAGRPGRRVRLGGGGGDEHRCEGRPGGKPVVFVKNREIIMVPKDNPANIKSLEDLSKPNIKLVLAAKDVPAADYAVEILGKANKVYGPNFKEERPLQRRLSGG